MEGAPKGVLRVSPPVALARLHVAPAITEFLRLYPGITLDLSLTDDVVNLVDDRLDLAVRIGSLESSSLISRKLAPHRRVVRGSPDYLAEHGEPHSPADLGRHNCLPFSYNTGGRVWRFSEETVRVAGFLAPLPCRSPASKRTRPRKSRGRASRDAVKEFRAWSSPSRTRGLVESHASGRRASREVVLRGFDLTCLTPADAE